jgi:hypothetical protein
VIEGNPRVVVVDHVLEVAKGVEADVTKMHLACF